MKCECEHLASALGSPAITTPQERRQLDMGLLMRRKALSRLQKLVSFRMEEVTPLTMRERLLPILLLQQA